MTHDFLETAMQFHAKHRSGRAKPIQDLGEAAHLSHAIARVLRELSRSQVAKHGDELMELIDKHLSEPELACVTDKSKPTRAELRQIAKRLARRRPHKTAIDRRLGWLCEELGFDEVDFAILGVLARWTLFDSWRELIRKASPSCSNPNTAIL